MEWSERLSVARNNERAKEREREGTKQRDEGKPRHDRAAKIFSERTNEPSNVVILRLRDSPMFKGHVFDSSHVFDSYNRWTDFHLIIPFDLYLRMVLPLRHAMFAE